MSGWRGVGVFMASLLLVGVSADYAGAEEAAPDITCTDFVYAVSGTSDDAPATVTFSAQQVLSRCASASGQALVIAVPNPDLVFTLEAHSSETRMFRIGNTAGEQASVKFTITRD